MQWKWGRRGWCLRLREEGGDCPSDSEVSGVCMARLSTCLRLLCPFVMPSDKLYPLKKKLFLCFCFINGVLGLFVVLMAACIFSLFFCDVINRGQTSLVLSPWYSSSVITTVCLCAFVCASVWECECVSVLQPLYVSLYLFVCPYLCVVVSHDVCFVGCYMCMSHLLSVFFSGPENAICATSGSPALAQSSTIQDPLPPPTTPSNLPLSLS